MASYSTSTPPMEIIMEILSQLPVISLLRIKSVCKSWYSLINDPEFVKLHLNQSNKLDHHLILSCSSGLFSAELYDDGSHVRFSELHHLKPIMSMNDHIRVISTCHGILCISTWKRSSVVLYNPLTKTHHKLPHALPVTPHISYQHMALGFGYDSVADDYKVLNFFSASRKVTHNAQVYSLKNNSWKWVENFPFFHINYVSINGGVVLNNAQHYLVKKDINITPDDKVINILIATFDYHHETHSILDLPYACKGEFDHYFPSLGRLNECLCVWYDLPNHYDCWIMREYGKKDTWAKLFSLNKTSQLMSRSLLTFSRNEGKVLLKGGSIKWFWFDLKTKKAEDVQVSGLPDVTYLFRVDSFVGSLVSVGEENYS